MYQASYSQSNRDDYRVARRHERAAFDQVLDLLQKGRQSGVVSIQCAEALYFVEKLWVLLLDDLAGDTNELPERLRAGLISIGIWITREVQDIRLGKTQQLDGLIEINQVVRDGLR